MPRTQIYNHHSGMLILCTLVRSIRATILVDYLWCVKKYLRSSVTNSHFSQLFLVFSKIFVIISRRFLNHIVTVDCNLFCKFSTNDTALFLILGAYSFDSDDKLELQVNISRVRKYMYRIFHKNFSTKQGKMPTT